MTDGSDVSPEAGGEIWGTLEELLLACAVSRHGTASWDSVATEVQTRSPVAARPRLTPRSCRLRFHRLHRRFSGAEAEEEEAAGEDPDASAADGWLDELRRLRVAELRREVERCDLSIGTLQSKVELMKEERERSVSGEATKPAEGVENVSSEEPGRSCRESNSTDLKPPGGGSVKEEEASGESMAASKESSASLCRRGRKAGGGEEESEEAASVAALLDRVAARFGPVFERLQESQESESYRGTIRRHVDLDAMRRKLDDGGGSYPSSELYRDLLLLCANAAVYLPRHAPEHAAAALHALRLVSAQVSASLREPTPPKPKRELLLGGGGTVVVAAAPASAAVDARRAEADIVGPLIQKATKPLIFCRKRSSIAKSAAATAVAAAVARKEAAEKNTEVAAGEESEGEKKPDVVVAAKDKAWGMRTKKTRGPGKNSAATKAAAAAKAAEDDVAAEADNKKSDTDTAAPGGLAKKRIAVDFLKRLNQGASTTKKRGSPLIKRKRAAPEQEAEEEQPKARRGPGRKGTGRGGRGGKAGATKRGVGRPPAKQGPAPLAPPPAKRAKVNNRTERSTSSSRRGGRKS